MIPTAFLLIICLAAFIASYLIVSAVCRWAQRRQVLDTPTERSSHTRPTARGGGLAIVVITLMGVWLVYYQFSNSDESWQALLAYTVGGVMIGMISWLDDLYSLPKRIRFATHCLGAIVAILFLGYWRTVSIPLLGELQLGWVGLPITFLWIVGLTNAYNFMDGIDGIAGSQGLIAGIGWVVIGWVMGLPLVAVLGALLAATSLGFLSHNWPPARIFMGDVGSAFLGYSFACLTVIAWQKDPAFILAGVLLVWPFVFDTIFTILRRLKNRENIFVAHRSHLYQRLVITGYSHRTVTILYMGLDLLGLLLVSIIVMKKSWADLSIGIALLLACLGLWYLTFIREKNLS